MGQLDEIKRLEKLQAGSYSEFYYMYDKYANMLYFFTFKLCHSKTTAEEIVQDTFLKVWVNREKIDPQKSFKAYLFTIAKNHFIDIFRQRIKDPLFEDYIEHTEDRRLSIETNVETIIDFDEFNRRLAKAKDKLTYRQREIFEMNKEQGLSAADVAQKLGITEQVVYNQISKISKQLKELMGDYSLLFIMFFM